MSMPKQIRESTIIITAGIILAGSAVWRLADGYDRSGEDVVITPVPETSAVSAVRTNTAGSTAAKTTVQTTTAFLLLDINSATAEELTQLSGIGEHLAGEIVGYREANGRFLNIEELMKISGIGEATFADIREHVYVVDPIYTTAVQTEKPTKSETKPTEAVEETRPPLTLEDVAPININTADAELLMLLPHVDEDTAEEIIELRDRLGHFSNTYELLYVESLTQSEVADILEYVVVE